MITRLTFAFCILVSHLAVASENADTVLRGGAIYTVDEKRSWAESLAIKGNKIIFVGTDTEGQNYIGEHTRVVELNGRMVLPGFQDAHIHPIAAMMRNQQLSLFGLRSRSDYLEKLRQYAADNPDLEWIRGVGWSHEYFDRDNPATYALLDEVVADRPVTLKSYDGHSLWVNSKAMAIAGINADTPDVSSGAIVRMKNSRQPSGLLVEDIAQRLVLEHSPDFSEEQCYQALMEVQSYLHSLGITSIQDAMLDMDNVGEFGTLPIYHKAASNGDLALRVVGSLYWNPQQGMEQVEKMVAAREQYSGGLFQATTVKVWQDGVLHTRTARLLEDYADDPGNRGTNMNPVPRLNELVQAVDKAGFQVHCHADGDGAIRQCLDAIELAGKANGSNDNRHHIAHLELIHPDDIPRFGQLNVVANVQPLWATHEPYISDLVDNKLGADRKRWMELNRSFFDAGARVAYSSDWFVTSANPLELIEAAVTRLRPALPLKEKQQSEPPLPGENVSLEDAIAAITMGSAYVNHQEDRTGSLEAGKLADLVVLDKNLFELPAIEISDTAVVLTFMDGRLVHGTLPLTTPENTP